VRGILIQIVFFTLVFNAISWLRETSLLSFGSEIPASQLVFETLAGEQLDLSQQGKKTVLYFFAPWCQVCNYSIANLQQLHEKTPSLEVVAIALDYQDKVEVQQFVARHQLTFPVAYGTTELKMQFQINAYPSYYVLDQQQNIIGKSIGYSTETGLLLRTLW
jgi:peroxiredoxin